MALFPGTPKPSYSYVLNHEFRTIISDFESGEEQRRTMWRFPKRTFALIYKILSITAGERDAIYEFYQNRRGPYESFWFFDFMQRKWVDQFVGYGDGIIATFDLPSKDTTQYPKIYVSAVEKTRVTHWNFVADSGEEGADQITFTAGNIPAEGALITTDLTGYLRIKGRFNDPKLTEEIFTKDFENISFSIYEVK
jgi:uncharacterized protein (TIGR02217 family)